MKQKARASLLIGVPMGPKPDERFLASLPKFLKECEGYYNLELVQVSNRTLVDAQNYIADYFLKSNHKYLLLMEDDHWGHSRNMLKSLLRADVPICGINYYSRYFPYYSCLMNEIPGREVQQRFGPTPYDSGCHQVDLVGYAMMLIRREVFSKLEKPYFRLNKDGGDDCYATDIDFCDRLKAVGIQPVGCFDYTLNHRDITPENVVSYRMSGFENIKKQRQEFLKEKGYIV